MNLYLRRKNLTSKNLDCSGTFAQEVVKEAFGESYTEHVKITLKNSDNLRMSAVYPPESSEDPIKGTLIQGYVLELLELLFLILYNV